MKSRPKRSASLKLAVRKYGLDSIRYAAYAVSDAAYVFLRPAAKGAVAVELSPKNGTGPEELARRFRSELADEKLRAAIFDANRDLREFMILKALSYEEQPPAETEDSGLTPEQEKELDALIAQVESEIAKESAAGKAGDPLGITRTWEEKYGAQKARRKK